MAILVRQAWFAALGLVVLPSGMLMAGRAEALEGDRIRPSVGVVANHYSNLFYVDDRIPAQQNPFLRDGRKSDYSYGLRLGLDMDIPVSRQTFTLRSQVTQNNYAFYDYLDNNSYNVRGVWNWAAGSKWDGDAGIGHRESLGSFVDTRTNEKNLRRQEDYFASAMYRVYYDWKLRAALSRTSLANSAARFRSADREDTVYELGSRRYGKGGESYLGVNLRATDGRFPNRQVVPGSTVDNSYTQYDVQGVVNWLYSGLTSLEGAAGWTNRLHDQVSERNFSGITGRLAWNYGLTGATALSTTVFRDINSFETVTSSYILVQGVRVGPNYRYSDKLSLSAFAGFSQRQFLGDPLRVALPSLPVRKDDVITLSASATWRPVLRAEIGAVLTWETRSSNIPLTDYDAVTAFLNAQYTF